MTRIVKVVLAAVLMGTAIVLWIQVARYNNNKKHAAIVFYDALHVGMSRDDFDVACKGITRAGGNVSQMNRFQKPPRLQYMVVMSGNWIYAAWRIEFEDDRIARFYGSPLTSH